MNKPELSQCVCDLLCVHEMLRKLGFPADDIYVHCYESGQVQMMLKRDGKQFTIDIARSQKRDLMEQWSQAVEWWNSNETVKEERDAVYESSPFRAEAVQLVMALTVRGFYRPPVLKLGVAT